VHEQLLAEKKGNILKPIYSPVTSSWVVIQLSENQIDRVKPLAEVKSQIVIELTQQRKQSLANKRAEEWLGQNPSLKVSSQDPDYQLISFQGSNIHANHQNIPLALPYLKAIERLQDKQPPLQDTLNGYSIILIPRTLKLNPKARADADFIRDLFIQSLGDKWFESWLDKKVEAAKVQIFVSP